MTVYVVIFKDNSDNTIGCIGVYTTIVKADKAMEEQQKMDKEDNLDYSYNICDKEIDN